MNDTARHVRDLQLEMENLIREHFINLNTSLLTLEQSVEEAIEFPNQRPSVREELSKLLGNLVLHRTRIDTFTNPVPEPEAT